MGSQRAASLSTAKSARIRGSFTRNEPTTSPPAKPARAELGSDKPAIITWNKPGKPSPSTGGGGTGGAGGVIDASIRPLKRTSSFVQCLSSRSVEVALGFLIEFANRCRFVPPDEIFNQYDISPEEGGASLGKFSTNLRKRLEEILTAQQQKTDSAPAAQDAIHQSLIDILERHMPRSKTRIATFEQITKAFAKEDSRTIEVIFLKNMISGLVDEIIDAADINAADIRIPRAQVERVKKEIREDFAPRLAKRIDDLARRHGVPSNKVPPHISEWAEELDKFVRNYIKRYKGK